MYQPGISRITRDPGRDTCEVTVGQGTAVARFTVAERVSGAAATGAGAAHARADAAGRARADRYLVRGRNFLTALFLRRIAYCMRVQSYSPRGVVRGWCLYSIPFICVCL